MGGDHLEKLDNALDKTVLLLEKGMRDLDRGFSKFENFKPYKKANKKLVKAKEKQIELILA